MSNSKIPPTEPAGASGQPKKPGPVVDDGLQDERRGWRRMTTFRAAKKMGPSNIPATQSPWTFHRFGDLPLEIRLYIWRLAWTPRMVMPYESKPALRVQCRGRQPCPACKCLDFQAPVRAPAVMQVCREARLETQRISRPVTTWLRESALLLVLRPSWSYAQGEERWANCDREEMLPVITHFNTESDVLYLNDCAIIHFCSQRPGPPNHDDVFQVALDPEMPLVLDGHYFDSWENPSDGFDYFPGGLQALYHRYLKPRKHVYIEVGRPPVFVLTEKGWQKAIQENLFSGDSLETRLVPIDDVRLIRKYEDLRHYCIPHTMKSREPAWDEYLWTGDPNQWHSRRSDAAYNGWVSNRLTASRENLSTAQLFMLQIADFLMWPGIHGSGDDKGEEIMDLDGQFKIDHPLVQQEGLRMPQYTAVITYQAATAPQNDQKGLYSRLPQMRPKYPEEDSSRLRLSMRRHLKAFLGRWGRSL